LIELYRCNKDILNDKVKVEEILMEAAKLSGARIVNSVFHEFNPHGVSGVVIIAESHFSIHTWPEYGYAACDVFTCGNTLKPRLAVKYLVEQFRAKKIHTSSIERGSVREPDT
jgi:S-adenosylmethionine decarboxylase